MLAKVGIILVDDGLPGLQVVVIADQNVNPEAVPELLRYAVLATTESAGKTEKDTASNLAFMKPKIN